MAPIPSAPLRLLVEDAQVIVAGRVNSVTPIPADKRLEGNWLSHRAEIAVTECWKGEAPNYLTVVYPQEMVCPMPPEFLVGSLVAAFLKQDRKTKEWEVVSLGYGARTLEVPEALEVYRARVGEMLKILEIKHGSRRRAAIADWLVVCAESPHTRWDGAYELNHTGPERGLWEDVRGEDFSMYLNDAHRSRLIRVVAESNDLHKSPASLLLRFAVPSRDPAVIQALKRSIEAALAEPDDMYGVPGILKALAEMLNRPEFEKLAEGSWSPRMLPSIRTEKMDKLRRLLAERLP